MRLQTGCGGDQGSDSGGDTYGDDQDVIDHQRRGGQQSGIGAEVEPRDGVGTAASGVGGDGLAVREIDDREQDDDGERDWDQAADAGYAQRDENRKGRLRSVGGGAERIEAEDRNSGRGTDLFRAGLVGGEGTS